MRFAFFFSLLVIGIFVLSGCIQLEETNLANSISPLDGNTPQLNQPDNLSNGTDGSTPSSPMKMTMEISNAPALNQTAIVSIKIESFTRDFPDTIATITLGEGLELIDGNLTWYGTVEKDSPAQLTLTIKSTKLGDWGIIGSAQTPSAPGPHWGGKDAIFIRVGDNNAVISRAPFVPPEDTDIAIPIADENQPILPSVDKNENMPEPVGPTVSAPTSPVKLTMSISNTPALNQTATIIVTVDSMEDLSDALLTISLDDGIEVDKSNLQTSISTRDNVLSWHGKVQKNQSVNFPILIRPTKVGELAIVADVRSPSDQMARAYVGGKDELYIRVEENNTILSRAPFQPSPGIEIAKPLLPSEVPKTEPVDKSKKTPRPTVPATLNMTPIAENEPNGDMILLSYKEVFLSPGTVTIEGSLFYKDESGNNVPLKWATVWFWDKDTGGTDDYLGAALTQTDGSFQSDAIENVDSDDAGTLDIFVEARATSSAADVNGSTIGDGIYNSYTSVTWNVSDGTHDIGSIEIGSPSTNRPAWWIYRDLLDGWEYVGSATPSFSMPKQTATWRYNHDADWNCGTSGTHYEIGGDIHVDGTGSQGAGHAKDKDVILHEYGHAVMYRVYDSWFPSAPNCSPHYIDTHSSDGCAWVEGWANFFPLAVYNDQYFTDTKQGFEVYFESREPSAPWDTGDDVEGNVAASLWDSYDSANDGYDIFSDGFNNIWYILYHQKDNGHSDDADFEDYWNAWLNRDYETLKFLDAARQNTIDFSGLTPGDLCSIDSQCGSGYCEGSQSYSSRCCSYSPTADGWYGGGNTQTATCGVADNDALSYYRDYYCNSSGTPQYENTNSKSCNNWDNWYGGGNTAGCGSDPDSYWQDYYVGENSNNCYYTTNCTGTNPVNCDSSDNCSPYCNGNIAVSYKDYYIIQNTDNCTYQESSEDCSTKNSTDSDGGNIPLIFGQCIDYTTCSTGVCTGNQYDDTCTSSIALTEYFNSGASYSSQGYTCGNHEVEASDTHGDDPTYTESCTGGTGAGCSGGKFNITSGNSGTDYCEGTCGTGADSCYFVEYYPADSDDACSGSDTCTSKTYNADTEQNTCNECKGTGYWNIGGDVSNCCGDDSSEYKKTRICETGTCTTSSSDYACCNSNTKCVYNSICYASGYSGDVDADTKTEFCLDGTWTTLQITYFLGQGGSKLTSQDYNITFSLTSQPTKKLISTDYNILLGWNYYYE